MSYQQPQSFVWNVAGRQAPPPVRNHHLDHQKPSLGVGEIDCQHGLKALGRERLLRQMIQHQPIQPVHADTASLTGGLALLHGS
jgi:hypothetical protein